MTRSKSASLCFAALAFGTATTSFAISQRHDPVIPPATFAQGFKATGLIEYSISLGDKRSGFLVGDKFIMSAAHNFPSATPGNITTIRINGVTYTTSGWIRHPGYNSLNLLDGYDVSIARLNMRVLDVEPLQLYVGSGDVGQVGAFAGNGGAGNGITGVTSYPWTLQAATNALDYDSGFPFVLLADFDRLGDPSTNTLTTTFGIASSASATSQEGTITPGDSGGPVMIQESGLWKVCGVNSAAQFLSSPPGKYGDLSFFTRLNAPGLVAWSKDKLWENGRVDGKITLGDTLLTTLLGKSVQIRLSNPGSVVALQTYNVPLTLSGGYSFVTSLRGNYDMQLRVNGWLRKVIQVNITNNGPADRNAVLSNGDIDFDNFVGLDDFNVLSNSFNLALGDGGYFAAADLDGDNFVGLDDFNVLSNNFNTSGED